MMTNQFPYLQTHEIVSFLLPAYERWVPSAEVSKLSSIVSKVLPPLSYKDVIKLSITLPLLSASLESGGLASGKDSTPLEAVLENLKSIDTDLAAYALNTDYDARSRSAAAASLHFSIVQNGRSHSNAHECRARHLLEEVIMPALVLSLDRKPGRSAKIGFGGDDKNVAFVDCLNLASVVVSSAPNSIAPPGGFGF